VSLYTIAHPHFDRLTQSRRPEAAFLIRRAKSINPELNVEQELKRAKELRMKK
jgi:hypothetical protein